MLRLVSNPPNPWLSESIEWLGPPPEARLEVHEEQARSILTENDSPDLSFRWSLNPYRGCQHACAYCYARRTHELLGFGAGTDFDRRIVVKVNAPELLAAELARRSWAGEEIVFSGATDCYQPLEASYRLTRRCLEACLARRNPVGIITKSALVRRDVELLAELGKRARVSVFVSIAFADDDLARAIEPGASAPSQRFRTLELLSAAGVHVGVALAPVMPGLNEEQIPAILERAAAAGARSAFLSPLRLSREVGMVFAERLREAVPGRADKVLRAAIAMRGGSGFGERMRGKGPRWDLAKRLFEMACRRHGIATGRTLAGERGTSGPQPGRAVQLGLFGAS